LPSSAAFLAGAKTAHSVRESPPRPGQAFAGESFVWLFSVAELLIAVTLNPWISLVAFLLGLVAHFLITRQIQKQRSAQRVG
jgi:hypothetical protein